MAAAADPIEFELEKPLGEGNFGKVFLCCDKKNKSIKYAMKVIDLNKAPQDEREAAERQARLLKDFEHENIIAYIHSFQERGALCIVTEFCDGGDLSELIEKRNGRSFNEDRVVDWFRQICSGLQYLHGRRVLHRGINTQNIFLTGPSKVAKLGGFGLAKVLERPSAKAVTFCGSPYYMSPEIFACKPYDTKSDIWAMGVCIYELSTLERPFDFMLMQQLVFKIVHGELPPMPEDKYSTQFCGLLEKMFCRDSQKRPTADDILADPLFKTFKKPKTYSEDLPAEIQRLGLGTVEDFTNMIKKSSYKCYWNRVYLVGPWNVGKTCLAKILVGDPIPEERMSTEGIWLYLGRAGLDIEERRWIFLPLGTTLNTTVVNMLATMDQVGGLTTPEESMHFPGFDFPTHESDIPNPSTVKSRKADSATGEKATEDSISPTNQMFVDLELTKTKLQSGVVRSTLTSADMHEQVISAFRDKGGNIKIIPFDLWDFGGQKDYYMTHQLFITSRGIYVIVFNGNVDIHELIPDLSYLPGHYGKPTIAVYLIHWVNSILTYCKTTTTGHPKIVFVATHKDKVKQGCIEKQRAKLIADIDELFSSHSGRHHLHYEPLYFVNGTDPNDPEIAELQTAIIDASFSHPRWGELMPTFWLPLELEISEQVAQGKDIISRDELETLNSEISTASLTSKQLETFLKVQHALGKLIYFDEVQLREYIVINPVYLIQVLCSIVTEKEFWPKEEKVQDIFQSLKTNGIIRKEHVFELWKRDEKLFKYRNFLLNIFVHLDILVEPKTKWLTNEPADVELYLVPCMISNSNGMKYVEKFCKKDSSITMAYKFIEEVIPPALLYRFLASIITTWSLKIYEDKYMLFTDVAVVSVDDIHDLTIHIEKNRLVVSLIHEKGKHLILPTIASTVQECLTASIHRISEFYSRAGDDEFQSERDTKKYSTIPFEIEFGVDCDVGHCFFPHSLISRTGKLRWRCPIHKKEDEIACLQFWFSEKKTSERCSSECPGLGRMELEQFPTEKQLRRLAVQLSKNATRQLIIFLGIPVERWEDLEDQYRYPNDLKFFALWKWRQSTSETTFMKLKSAVEESGENAHRLCQVFRDIDIQTSCLSDSILSNQPEEEALERLSNHIGEDTLQLGIELGLNIAELKSIECRHKYNLMKQTHEILKTWFQSGQKVEILAKALQRIERISCLEQCFL